MFNGCSSLVNLDLSSFDTSIEYNFSNLFKDCTSLKINLISLTHMSAFTIFAFTFMNCQSLEN